MKQLKELISNRFHRQRLKTVHMLKPFFFVYVFFTSLIAFHNEIFISILLILVYGQTWNLSKRAISVNDRCAGDVTKNRQRKDEVF